MWKFPKLGSMSLSEAVGKADEYNEKYPSKKWFVVAINKKGYEVVTETWFIKRPTYKYYYEPNEGKVWFFGRLHFMWSEV